jgi:hypothetical protein
MISIAAHRRCAHQCASTGSIKQRTYQAAASHQQRQSAALPRGNSSIAARRLNVSSRAVNGGARSLSIIIGLARALRSLKRRVYRRVSAAHNARVASAR